MPLVSTATSFTVVPTEIGQRISQVTYGRMPQEYYFDIDIQDTQFIINVCEDKIETGFSIESLDIDFIQPHLLNNLVLGQMSLPRSQTATMVDVTPYNGWSTSSYVIISDPELPDGTTATAVLNIADGQVTGITLTNPGSGYVYMPTVKAYDPEAPLPPGVTLAHQPYPNQLPGGVRVHLDPSTVTTGTVTYLRGTLPMTLDEFKRRAVNLDDNTLWAFETNYVRIRDNVKPNRENQQSAGLDVQMIRFFDAFDYLGKSLSPAQFGTYVRLYQFGRLLNILQNQTLDPTPRIETPGYFDADQHPFFWIFVHDKDFTSFKDCTWKFAYPFNRRELIHPAINIRGASASEFHPSAAAAVENVQGVSQVYHVPPQTDWTQYLDPIYCVVADEPVNAGDPINVQVHTAPHIDYLYVQQVCGVPDRTRISLTDGVGQFNILTSTLTAGETAAAWVGFKHWPKVVEVLKTLS